jgi:hypothetical protein
MQWQLVERLIDAWGEGEGAQDAPTSIFVVGDRKQSTTGFATRKSRCSMKSRGKWPPAARPHRTAGHHSQFSGRARAAPFVNARPPRCWALTTWTSVSRMATRMISGTLIGLAPAATDRRCWVSSPSFLDACAGRRHRSRAPLDGTTVRDVRGTHGAAR